jgi:hypothetical protein
MTPREVVPLALEHAAARALALATAATRRSILVGAGGDFR